MHAKFETRVRLFLIYKNRSRLNGLFRLQDNLGWKEADKHSSFFFKCSYCVGLKTQKEN